MQHHEWKTNSIKGQKLILCWWKYKISETQGLANWWLCSNMFESQRVGAKPFASSSQPALMFNSKSLVWSSHYFFCKCLSDIKVLRVTWQLCSKAFQKNVFKRFNSFSKESTLKKVRMNTMTQQNGAALSRHFRVIFGSLHLYWVLAKPRCADFLFMLQAFMKT